MVYLQETHYTKNYEKVWKDKWVGKIYFLNGTSNSSGVAILLNIDFELCEKKM